MSAQLILVRHGETPPNREGVLLGRADPGLTDQGRRQAQALADALTPLAPARVVTSPLRRCRETAVVIAEAAPCSVAEDDRLIEVDYGEWEGQPLPEVPAEASRRWRDDAAFRPPGGESLEDVAERVHAWCEEIRERAEGTVVAVSHVSPIKAVVAWALGVDAGVSWRMFLGVASLTRVALGPDGPVLLSFNERGHLSDEAEDRSGGAGR